MLQTSLNNDNSHAPLISPRLFKGELNNFTKKFPSWEMLDNRWAKLETFLHH